VHRLTLIILKRQELAEEAGFTLIELLVVILILGILAAIALPEFLGQNTKAKDAAAESNARNLVSIIDTCESGKDDFRECDTEAELTNDGAEPISLPYGSGPGEVEVAKSWSDRYDAVGHSTSGTDFTISRNKDGTVDRTCKPKGAGSCPASGNW
jgi:type IV pilus assembly protein PilA